MDLRLPSVASMRTRQDQFNVLGSRQMCNRTITRRLLAAALAACIETRRVAIYSLLATGLVLVAAGPAVAALTDDLVAYYHLDGNGDDSSGNGLNLTIP